MNELVNHKTTTPEVLLYFKRIINIEYKILTDNTAVQLKQLVLNTVKGLSFQSDNQFFQNQKKTRQLNAADIFGTLRPIK